ncbi:kinase-like domain-containing protein [Melanogaster broomeanus]|nr:kinase-like domain-containing protein [Melanogaster broomeanus]
MTSSPVVLGSHQPTQILLSHALAPESRLEELPMPWGTLSDSMKHPNDRPNNAVVGLSRADLDQEVTQRLLQQEPWSASTSSAAPFPPAHEAHISPAAMFLASFSPSSIQPTRLPDDAGETVAGYVLGPVIGRGGFSTIRRASSPSGGIVAIKIVRRSDLARQSDPTLAKKHLDHETEVWSSLNHEHILPLFAAEHTPYADFFVTLLCPAGSLFDILTRDGTPALPHDDAGMLFRQVVRGVRYLHESSGYVHRDIKLENVLVDEMGVCKICDFGLSRRIGESDDEDHLDGEDHTGAVHRHRSTISHTRRLAKAALPSHLSMRHGARRHRTSSPFGDQSPAPVHPAHAFQPGSLPYAAPELLSPQTSGKHHGVYDMPSDICRGADLVLRGCLRRDVSDRWTIAMVDDMAWGIGLREVGRTSSLTREDEFEFVDYPTRRSPSSRSKSLSDSRARRNHNSTLPQSSSRTRRSLSRTSATTTSSLSTRNTSGSGSRPPIRRLPLPQECDLSHSVLSAATPLSSTAPLEIGDSSLTPPSSCVERGRRLKRVDPQPTNRFAPSLGASTTRSEFGLEPSSGEHLYSGTDILDNTARWASAVQLNAIAEVSTHFNGTPSAVEKLRAIQIQMDSQTSKRAESTPPAPSAWPRRSRARVNEDLPSFRFAESRGIGGAFLREPSATPISIPRKNGTRSRSVGDQCDIIGRRPF